MVNKWTHSAQQPGLWCSTQRTIQSQNLPPQALSSPKSRHRTRGSHTFRYSFQGSFTSLQSALPIKLSLHARVPQRGGDETAFIDVRQALQGFCFTLFLFHGIAGFATFSAILPRTGSASLRVLRQQGAIVSPAENLLASEKRPQERYPCRDDDEVCLDSE